jgi:hypothetical protein
MANVLVDRPMESGRFAVRSRFGERHSDMTIVDQSSARSFPAASI